MQPNNYVIGIIIGFLIICIIVLALAIFIKLYINKIKNYNQLLHQKEIDQQKTITETVIETQENVLDVISNELHDDAGQQLTYINLQVEQLKLSHPKFQEVLLPISESIGNLSNSIRTLSHTISHQKIKNTTLIDGLTNEVNRLNRLNIVMCRIEIEENFSYQFSETEQIILYRMFQEISNNVLKHSRAENFSIVIKQTPNIQLIFKDNGLGFNTDNINLNNTNGQINLKHRAQLINYVFMLYSKKGEGTTITLTKNATPNLDQNGK